MHVIGEETAETPRQIPAQYQVIVTTRPKYAGRSCEGGNRAGAQRRSV